MPWMPMLAEPKSGVEVQAGAMSLSGPLVYFVSRIFNATVVINLHFSDAFV
jgi:hypothetical protein